jgi:hypothetical protein
MVQGLCREQIHNVRPSRGHSAFLYWRHIACLLITPTIKPLTVRLVFLAVYWGLNWQQPLGHRKILDIHREIESLRKIENANLLKIYAAQLDEMQGIPRLTILLEQRTGPSLRDVLLHSDGLNVDRALVRIGVLETV